MMHFWRKEYFNSLKDVAAKARRVALWVDYADFCERYEKGLRSEAFTILERFISSMEQAPFKERQDFVSWLLRESDGRDGRTCLSRTRFTFAWLSLRCLSGQSPKRAVPSRICGWADTTT